MDSAPRLSGKMAPMLFFCCQIASLGMLRHTPSFSLWGSQIEAYPELSGWLARILSVLVFAVAIAVVNKGPDAAFGPRAVAVFGVGLLCGCAITLYASSTFALYVCGQVLIGVCHAWILVCWAQRLAGLSASERNCVIVLSALLAVILLSVESAVPGMAKGAFFLAVVVGSVVPLVLVPRGDLEAPTRQVSVKEAFDAMPIALIFLMVSYALLFRIMVLFDFQVQNQTAFTLCTCGLRVGGMALLVWYYFRKGFNPSIRQIVMPLLLLAIVGVALLPARSEAALIVSLAVIQAGWTFFYTTLWIALFEIGSRRGNPLVVFLCGWTAMNAVLLLAVPLVSLFKDQVNSGALSVAAIALILAYMFSVALLLLRKRDSSVVDVDVDGRFYGEAPLNEVGDPRNSQSDFLAALSQEYGLTQREGEVFEYLAKGYSLPAIEQELVISHSTVKGHARSIYRKFQVENKQGLISLVNQRLSGQSDAKAAEQPAGRDSE